MIYWVISTKNLWNFVNCDDSQITQLRKHFMYQCAGEYESFTRQKMKNMAIA